jgi:hypothetical protein
MSYATSIREKATDRLRGSPRELRIGGIEELTKFLASVFGVEPSVWQEWFAHWWTFNPAHNESIPRGWTVRSAAGELVAFTANIPFPYAINGKPALCCATGSTAVDSNWRGVGLSKLVGQKFIDQTQGDILVAVESTAVAHGLWRSLGMKSLDEPWLENHSRVFANVAALGSTLSQNVRLPPLVGRAAEYCTTLWLDSPLATVHRSRSLPVTRIDQFSELDARGIETCKASNASTYSYRDVRTLNWLYFGSQYLKRTRVVLVARSRCQVVGYLSMKRVPTNTYYMLECRCRDADPDIARELILAARDCARQHRVSSIILRPYTPMIEAAVPRALSVRVSRRPTTYCYKFKSDTVNRRNWEPSPADGDVSVY